MLLTIVAILVILVVLLALTYALKVNSNYNNWNEAFNRAKSEREKNGCSPKYWEIWNNEVWPLYLKLQGRDPDSKGTKPWSQL
jgi:hypothetical protein